MLGFTSISGTGEQGRGEIGFKKRSCGFLGIVVVVVILAAPHHTEGMLFGILFEVTMPGGSSGLKAACEGTAIRFQKTKGGGATPLCQKEDRVKLLEKHGRGLADDAQDRGLTLTGKSLQ
jgi:hypothetical protein